MNRLQPRPPPHRRLDRVLAEVSYPGLELNHPIAQINYITVSALGQECPPHSHEHLTETFIVLEGWIRFCTSEPDNSNFRETVLTSGCQLTVEPGTIHSLQATPDTRYLELRSSLYKDELFNPDKQFKFAEDREKMEVLNREAAQS